MFAQCSGNSVISSCTVCITFLNSEDVPTMSISISQILVLPDITDVKLPSVCQLFLYPGPFLHFTTASPTFHTFSTMLIAPSTVLISDPTESQSQNHDHRIAPMIAESHPTLWPWRGTFSPSVVLNVFLKRTCFCSVFITYLDIQVNNGSEYA